MILPQGVWTDSCGSLAHQPRVNVLPRTGAADEGGLAAMLSPFTLTRETGSGPALPLYTTLGSFQTCGALEGGRNVDLAIDLIGRCL